MSWQGAAMVGKKVLILDENEASRRFLSNLLQENQFEVFIAPSGKEALISAWRDEPDLILFDPVLTDIQPGEFVQKLRDNARTNVTPIIALSSDSDSARKAACLIAGVNEYLVKSSETLAALDVILKRMFSMEPPTEPIGEVEREKGLLIVFLSAKGGTGTSSLCANLAMNIKVHQPAASVVVADLVLPIGSIAQIVGSDEKLNLVTVAGLPSTETTGNISAKICPSLSCGNSQLLPWFTPIPQHGNNLKGDPHLNKSWMCCAPPMISSFWILVAHSRVSA